MAQYLTKFNIFEINYIKEYLEVVKNIFKNYSKKTKFDNQNLQFILNKWKGLSDLNFDEAFASFDSSDKSGIKFIKFDFMKMFEKELNDANNNGLVKEINQLITLYKTQVKSEVKGIEEEDLDDNNTNTEKKIPDDQVDSLERTLLYNSEEEQQKSSRKNIESEFSKSLDEEIKALDITKLTLYDKV